MSELRQIVAAAGHMPFFALVRLCERALPTRARLGGSGPFDVEPVRFRHDPSLAFHTADVVAAELVGPADAPSHVVLTTSFSGLTGAVSPLPLYFAAELCEEDKELERTFLDLFHHRLLGLLTRGVTKYTTACGAADEPARLAERILMLAGLDPLRAEAITGLTLPTLLRLAPLLVTYPPNGERLRIALVDVLGDLLEEASVQVIPMVGRAVTLASTERPRLGVDARLAVTSTLGGRVRAPASLVRVEIGPLSPACCARLAPDGDRHTLLSAVVALFTPESIDAEIALRPASAPPSHLSRAWLGRTSWLGPRGTPAPLRFRSRPLAGGPPCASIPSRSSAA